MDSSLNAILQKLVAAPGPSGYESQVRDVVRAEVEPLVDDLRVDGLGSLIARKGSLRPGGLKILLAAHLDEIGLIVTHLDENGFARFQPLGVYSPGICIGGRVRFLNGTQGVIGMERLEEGKLPTFEQLFIDLGLSERSASPVRVGDAAVFERPFLELNGRLVSKALDNRLGAALLIEALRQLKADLPHEIYALFSVQEEVRAARGAGVAAFAVDPDLAIAVDTTLCGDTPKGPRLEMHMGQGPAIKVRDGRMLSDPRLVDWMIRTAEAHHLPYQMEILPGTYTDASSIQPVRGGVPVGCLSVPCRYVHTPSEMADTTDIQNTLSLLVALLSGPIEWLSASR